MLADELTELGATGVRMDAEARPGQVRATGDAAMLYRALFHLRTANRVLLPVGAFQANTREALYEGARALAWEQWLGRGGTLAVDGHVRSSALSHSQFAALVIKDAIVDRLRDVRGERPNIDKQQPSLRVVLRLDGNEAQLFLDAGGGTLHGRGYRVSSGVAPLKETLAAGIVRLSGWRPEEPLYNPMCGTGTIAMEAALMGLDIAPGMLRKWTGITAWPVFDRKLWNQVQSEAQERKQRRQRQHEGSAPSRPLEIIASDGDRRALAALSANLAAVGLTGHVGVRWVSLEALTAPSSRPGVLIANPPYGERMGADTDLAPLYRTLGDRLKQGFAGWRAYILVGNLELRKSIGLRTSRRMPLMNGPIECRLLEYKLFPGAQPSSQRADTSAEPA